MQVRIVCINKDGGNHTNPNESISHYGWENPIKSTSGRATKEEMVAWIEADADNNKAYVEDKEGKKAYCDVRKSSAGNKFLQTYSDGYYNNNLLSLDECRV